MELGSGYISEAFNDLEDKIALKEHRPKGRRRTSRAVMKAAPVPSVLSTIAHTKGAARSTPSKGWQQTNVHYLCTIIYCHHIQTNVRGVQ